MRSPWLVLVLLACIVTGLALLSFAIGASVTPPVYARVFDVHGVVGLAWYFQAFAFLLPGRPGTDRRRLGFASMHVAASSMIPRWPLAAAVLLLVAIGGLLVGVLAIRSASGLWFVIATLGQATMPIGILIGRPDLVTMLMPPLFVATLVQTIDPRARRSLLAATVAGGSYVLMECRTFLLAGPPPRGLELAAAAGLFTAVVVSARRERWQRASQCVAAALFLESALLLFVQQASASSPLLPDTLFVVGRGHLEAFVLLVAIVGTLGRAGRSRVGWAGLALLTAGAHALGWLLVVVGLRGMPRRYAHHLEVFLPLERGAFVASLILASGLVLVGLAQQRARTNLADV